MAETVPDRALGLEQHILLEKVLMRISIGEAPDLGSRISEGSSRQRTVIDVSHAIAGLREASTCAPETVLDADDLLAAMRSEIDARIRPGIIRGRWRARAAKKLFNTILQAEKDSTKS